MLLVHPTAKPPTDPNTGLPVSDVAARFAFLEAEIQSANETILIPTPALAEVLVRLGDAGPTVLDRISRSARFKIAEFDTMAAVEVAAMTRDALRAGDKRAGSKSDWQKVKIDRQIIAIAKLRGATKIYSDDRGVALFAEALGIEVIQTWKMPLPPPPPPSLFDEYEPRF